MKVELLPQAERGLDAIADPLYGRLLKRLAALGEFPELGKAMTGDYAGLRSTVVDFIRVVYRIRADEVVEVAFIRDCRRRPPKRP